MTLKVFITILDNGSLGTLLWVSDTGFRDNKMTRDLGEIGSSEGGLLTQNFRWVPPQKFRVNENGSRDSG